MRAATNNSRSASQRTVRTISIHAAHAGSDQTITDGIADAEKFQSTLPMRAATYTFDFEKVN